VQSAIAPRRDAVSAAAGSLDIQERGHYLRDIKNRHKSGLFYIWRVRRAFFAKHCFVRVERVQSVIAPRRDAVSAAAGSLDIQERGRYLRDIKNRHKGGLFYIWRVRRAFFAKHCFVRVERVQSVIAPRRDAVSAAAGSLDIQERGRYLRDIKNRHKGGLFYIWRRERDSNPRYAINVYTLSRRAPSTTRTSLQKTDCHFICWLLCQPSMALRAMAPSHCRIPSGFTSELPLAVHQALPTLRYGRIQHSLNDLRSFWSPLGHHSVQGAQSYNITPGGAINSPPPFALIYWKC
jgi:phage-related protein